MAKSKDNDPAPEDEKPFNPAINNETGPEAPLSDPPNDKAEPALEPADAPVGRDAAGVPLPPPPPVDATNQYRTDLQKAADPDVPPDAVPAEHHMLAALEDVWTALKHLDAKQPGPTPGGIFDRIRLHLDELWKRRNG